mmetsp:Transcript_104341/g.304585  ORF Transcript_104341/g.304585 Transcript_104341/m.304585 type:complete len:117 (-) Transcript_104341:6-356(-)
MAFSRMLPPNSVLACCELIQRIFFGGAYWLIFLLIRVICSSIEADVSADGHGNDICLHRPRAASSPTAATVLPTLAQGVPPGSALASHFVGHALPSHGSSSGKSGGDLPILCPCLC